MIIECSPFKVEITYSTDIDIDPLLSLDLGNGMESIVSSSILDSDRLNSQVGINAKDKADGSLS